MPCFDGMHCVDFLMSESSEGSLPIAVGDFVAVHARTSRGMPHVDTRKRGCGCWWRRQRLRLWQAV
jgi:hypothetical protein